MRYWSHSGRYSELRAAALLPSPKKNSFICLLLNLSKQRVLAKWSQYKSYHWLQWVLSRFFKPLIFVTFWHEYICTQKVASKPGFFPMLCSAYFTVLLRHPNNYSFLCTEHPYDLCFFSVLKTNLCFLRLLGGTLTLILLCLYALKWWCFVWFRISRAWLRILRSAWPSLLGGNFFCYHDCE